MIKAKTHYSFGLSVIKPSHLASFVDSNPDEFVLVDDEANLGGVAELQSIKKTGWGIGVSLYFTPSKNHSNKDAPKISLMCYTQEGLENLMQISTLSTRPEYKKYGQPRVDFELLKKYNEGLLVFSGGLNGWIYSNGFDGGLADNMLSIFGDRLIIELPYKKEYSNNEIASIKKALVYAKEKGLLVIASRAALIPSEQEQALFKNIVATSKKFNGGDSDELFLLSQIDYIKEISLTVGLSQEEEKQIRLSNKLLKKIGDSVSLSKAPIIPKITDVASSIDDSVYYGFLDKLQNKELKDLLLFLNNDSVKNMVKLIIKNGKIDLSKKEVLDRLFLEIKTYSANGLVDISDYFLFIADVVNNLVKTNKITRGFGRGSGAGSLVAYALDITDVNPLEYDLIFERFYSKERVGKMLFFD